MNIWVNANVAVTPDWYWWQRMVWENLIFLLRDRVEWRAKRIKEHKKWHCTQCSKHMTLWKRTTPISNTMLRFPSYSIIMLSTSISPHYISLRSFFSRSIFNNFIIAPYRYANGLIACIWKLNENIYRISSAEDRKYRENKKKYSVVKVQYTMLALEA